MSTPLFEVYGQIIDQLFTSDSQVGDPVAVCIESSQTVPKNRDDDASELFYETLAAYASPAKLHEIQNAVDTLRRLLLQEKEKETSPTSGKTHPKATGTLTQKLLEFRSALLHGDEAKLENNPFYSIAKLVYRLNLDAASGLLHYVQSKSNLHPPKPVPFVPTLVEIWGAGNRKAGFFNKLSATIDKWLNSGKLPIEIVVFFGSTFTTARGVSDLLQMPGALPFMTEGLGSVEAEFKRNLISLLCGLILSSAILDYKARLFSSVAEAGAVFRGIWHAFKRYPRWMILATILTLISIKTNYDGIVSLVSKKADLDQQSYEIKKKVRKALGNPRTAKATNPSNLYDLQVILQEAAGVATQKFLQIPKDEAGGGASSGNVGQGPRYWGKYYVIMGGYEPGTADVFRAVNNSEFAKNMDRLMRESGLDLKTSIPDKIAALRIEYEHHLKKTADLVTAKLAKLDALMRMKSYSWAELSRVFTLEHYEINDIVKEITKALEENTFIYKGIATRMNALTDSHVALLITLDRTGIVGDTKYQIDAKAPIPNIDAIDELKKNNIPVATHKSFEELKVFLNETYGIAMASTLLLIIFLVAISMDMANPMLYSRLTAIQGQRDRKAFQARIKKLKEWENDFATRCKLFFDREEVAQMLAGMPFPNDTTIRNCFSMMLEEVNYHVKDHNHFTSKEKSIAWFKSLFETTRIVDITGYNARSGAVHELLALRELFFVNFLNRILPDAMDDELLTSGTFNELLLHVEAQSVSARDRLVLEMQQALEAENRHSVEEQIRVWLAERRVASHSVTEAEAEQVPVSRKIWLEGWFKKSKPKSALDRLTEKLEQAKRSEEENVAKQQLADDLASRMASKKAELDARKQALEEDEGNDDQDAEDVAPSISWLSVFWYYLLHKAFMAPVGFFAYTRLSWLREIEARNRQFGEGLETLYEFIPTLKITLSEILPRIQEETFEPLMDIWNRFPIHCTQSGIEGVEEMEQKYMEIEKRTLEIWGISQFLGPDLDEKVLTAITNKDEIDEMARIITGDGGQSLFVERLHTLDKEMQEALGRAKAVEAAAIAEMRGIVNSVTVNRDEINQILLKINLKGLEMRSLPLPPQSLLRSLSQNREEIDDAPRIASSILARIESILNTKNPFDEQKFDELRSLERESREILDKVRKVMSSLNRPHHIDRRLEAELAQEGEVPAKGDSGNIQVVAARGNKRDLKRPSSPSRREAERQPHETRVMFTCDSGVHCSGVTRDISVTGVKMLTYLPLQGIAVGEKGTLRLVWDGGSEQFVCQVRRVSGNELGLQFVEEHSGELERFQALAREELIAELEGQVEPAPPFKPSEEMVPTGAAWTAVLAKQSSRFRLPAAPGSMPPVVQCDLLDESNRAIESTASVTQARHESDRPRLLSWGPQPDLVGESASTSIDMQPVSETPRLLPWGPQSLLVEESTATDVCATAALVTEPGHESTRSDSRLVPWGPYMDDKAGEIVEVVESMETSSHLDQESSAHLDQESALVEVDEVPASRMVLVQPSRPRRLAMVEGADNPWQEAESPPTSSVHLSEIESLPSLEVHLPADAKQIDVTHSGAELEPVVYDGRRVIRDIRERLDDAEQLVLRVNLRLLELRRSSRSEAGLSQALGDYGDILERVPLEIDAIAQGVGELPDGLMDQTSRDFRRLRALQSETVALWERIIGVLVGLEMTPPSLPPLAEPILVRALQPPRRVQKGVGKRGQWNLPILVATDERPRERSMRAYESVAIPSSLFQGLRDENMQQNESVGISETLFQSLRDENMKLRRDLRPIHATRSRARIPVALIAFMGGLWHVLYV
ncbi:MAG: PilZ domain-containing protein [Magnetococcus sp. YQC-5]